TKVFAQKPAKTFAVCPRTVVSGRGSDAPCGEGSQTGDGNTGGNKRQVPAKRQNRGSRNSTDDGG
ncbi:single-stranded DNA-binding protein, partial [Escherichia coli]|nr:single-stranded DNA-binding protein [Escherichia coli]MCE3589625.1 single-stranded DNA-binding protein [Escherichia coli]